MGESSLDEVALGGFLEDIGKFMQRAHARNGDLPAAAAARETDVLPSRDNRSSHWHALWSDAFFDEIETAGSSLPGGLNLTRVRDAAVFHHHPGTPLQWLSAEADRLSAGMDRKPKDEDAELAEPAGRDAFRRTALHSLLAGVDIGHGVCPRPAGASHLVGELTAENIFPRAVDGNAQKEGYHDIWPRFLDQFIALCRRAPSLDLFHEGVISLSERFTWAIPSSTVDQPDVPLHDHNKSVAAIAACLYLFHRQRGDLDSEASIRDRNTPKFRFLEGDLSGIQASLFRLASQGVKGVNRILRARSFLMGAALEAVALACRRALGLPPYCLLQAAGGRFRLLVPDLPGVDEHIDALRKDCDEWFASRYCGDLSLTLALGPAFGGRGLMLEGDRLAATLEDLHAAATAAKLHPLRHAGTGIRWPSGEAEGPCPACGVRPATEIERTSDGDIRRCTACHAEHLLGRLLPKARVALWYAGKPPRLDRASRSSVAMPLGLWLTLSTEEPRDDDAAAWANVVSGYHFAGAEAAESCLPARFVANHVPHLDETEIGAARYRHLSDEARTVTAGDIKTFEHLAADSMEEIEKDQLVGRPMLAVLKADVDWLGQVMSRGLADDHSIGRLAALSRMLDAYFTLVLPQMLRREFPLTYVVYAGGDDLLLLGPWRQIIRLAARLEDEFRRYVGGNPNVTLSAGIEFCGVDEPLNRVVRRAEERLEAAKDSGKNRVALIAGDPQPWSTFNKIWEDANRISDLIRSGSVSTAFVYRALSFAREKAKADGGDVRAAMWRARWGYHLRRRFPAAADVHLLQFFDGLLGSGFSPAGHGSGAVIPLVIALYRNR